MLFTPINSESLYGDLFLEEKMWHRGIWKNKQKQREELSFVPYCHVPFVFIFVFLIDISIFKRALVLEQRIHMLYEQSKLGWQPFSSLSIPTQINRAHKLLLNRNERRKGAFSLFLLRGSLQKKEKMNEINRRMILSLE